VDGFGLDDAAAALGDVGATEVFARIEVVGEAEFFGERHVAQGDDIEESVVELGVGGDHHTAAEVAAIGDGDVVDGALGEGLAVDLHADGLVAVGEGGAERSEEEGGLAAEPFGALVDEAIGEAGDAEAGDVDEGAGQRVPLVIRDAERAQVDGATGAPEATDGLFEAAGEAEGALEIAPGSGGDHGQIGPLQGLAFVVEVSLDGLVEGAIAADDSQGLDAIFTGEAGEAGGVTGTRGLGDIMVDPLPAQRFSQGI